MTVQNPAIFLQAGSHPAEDVRRYFAGVSANAEGVLMVASSATSSLEVTEKSGTPDMSVDVAEGSCLIAGTEGTYQGTYFCENRGTSNLAISAADATNERYDLIVAKVEDSDYSGATDAWSLAVVTGTPAASPADPSVPDNSITLARVSVPALDTSIEDAQITDLRPWARLWGETGLSEPSVINTPTATTTAGTIEFDNPSRPVYITAHGHIELAQIADFGNRKAANFLVGISIDGGSSWTNSDTMVVDLSRTAADDYRDTGSASTTIGPVLPTGDIHVRIQHQLGTGSLGDTESRSLQLIGEWKPA